MNYSILQKAMRICLGGFLVFSFSQCSKSSALQEGEATMNSNMAAKSLNLKKEYKATLNSLNNSGAHGTATLWLDGNMLTVKIEAMGLEPNKLHPQHIHGFADDSRNATCPSMTADTNGDGLVDLVEGLPSYGPVLLELGPLPTADAMGNVSYIQTFEISMDLLPLQNRAIVLHGLTVNGEYVATLPVACGQIQSWNSNMN
ncbi:MAG TPA: CHRD domain-containing protein [Chitinophagaceae bacterium]